MCDELGAGIGVLDGHQGMKAFIPLHTCAVLGVNVSQEIMSQSMVF